MRGIGIRGAGPHAQRRHASLALERGHGRIDVKRERFHVRHGYHRHPAAGPGLTTGAYDLIGGERLAGWVELADGTATQALAVGGVAYVLTLGD